MGLYKTHMYKQQTLNLLKATILIFLYVLGCGTLHVKTI